MMFFISLPLTVVIRRSDDPLQQEIPFVGYHSGPFKTDYRCFPVPENQPWTLRSFGAVRSIP